MLFYDDLDYSNSKRSIDYNEHPIEFKFKLVAILQTS